MRISLIYLGSLFLFNNSYGFVLNSKNPVVVERKLANYNSNNKFKSKKDDDEETNKIDIIEGIGGFMGYPKERKWKGFRIACYSIFAGSILRSAVVDLGNYIDNKINNDSLDQYSSVAHIIKPNYEIENEKIVNYQNLKHIKILDEPYLCDNIKFI
jgi:hypothetical protein